MPQVAALLRSRVTTEVTQYNKTKNVFVTLVDWDKIGRDDGVAVKFYNQGVTRDKVQVKVSLV
jgi:hypothetical protein